MTEQQSRQLEIGRAIPSLILAILALTILAYGTARMVALLSPPPKATGEPVVILDSAPPDPAKTAAIWIFVLAWFLFALWPLIARRQPVLARIVLIVGVFVILALLFSVSYDSDEDCGGSHSVLHCHSTMVKQSQLTRATTGRK